MADVFIAMLLGQVLFGVVMKGSFGRWFWVRPCIWYARFCWGS